MDQKHFGGNDEKRSRQRWWGNMKMMTDSMTSKRVKPFIPFVGRVVVVCLFFELLWNTFFSTRSFIIKRLDDLNSKSLDHKLVFRVSKNFNIIFKMLDKCSFECKNLFFSFKLKSFGVCAVHTSEGSCTLVCVYTSAYNL